MTAKPDSPCQATLNFQATMQTPGSVFTNQSLEHSLSYSPDFFYS